MDTNMNDAVKSNVKFSNQQINELFEYLNKDKLIRSKLTYTGIRPARLEHFNSRSQSIIKNNTIGLFNSYMTVDAGHVYENWPNSVRSETERLEKGKQDLDIVLNRIKQMLIDSSNPLFKTLKIDVVSKDIALIRTKIDHGDDGDDWYGIQVFLKIHY